MGLDQIDKPSGVETPVLCEVVDGVANLTLNRPRHHNALSEALIDELAACLDRLDRDAAVRVVVLGAAGDKAFSAGHDLKEMQARRDRAHYGRLFDKCSQMMVRLPKLAVPVIAKVRGLATAAGCQLVAACDLAVAGEAARFGTSGINVGLFCMTPSVPLSRSVRPKQAFEMLFTGDLISAEKACEIGLVNRVVPAQELDDAVSRLAHNIAAKSQVAVRAGKRAFYRQLSMPLDEAYAYTSICMADNMMADDVFEGIDAFIHKRPPRWRDC